MPWRERLVLLLKEPIVPFLLVGAGLFAMQAWWSSSGGRASSEIVVSDEQAVTLDTEAGPWVGSLSDVAKARIQVEFRNPTEGEG